MISSINNFHISFPSECISKCIYVVPTPAAVCMINASLEGFLAFCQFKMLLNQAVVSNGRQEELSGSCGLLHVWMIRECNIPP